MIKIDFTEREYSLDEIIEAYTDGSLDNFKGDQDFLDFIISYAIGNDIVGPDADKYKTYADYDGCLNIMSLDSLGYLGKKLYKIYEICEKDKLKFIEFCAHIGKIALSRMIDESLIDKNLELKEPVPFIDKTIILSTGKKPKAQLKEMIPFIDLTIEEEQEYSNEINRSLSRRINESIRKNNDNVEPVPEMLSYVAQKQKKEEEENKKRVLDNYIVNINNLYYGTEIMDTSGGVLGINMKMVAWFEYTNMDFLTYHFFRNIPSGDYCLVDNNGQIHIPETIIKHNNISVGPNTPIRSVNIANVPTILLSAIKKLEEDPLTNEISIMNLRSLLELLESKGAISVADINKFDSIIRTAYEIAYGEIFPSRPDTEKQNDGNLSL